jgi:hypothetical protein
MPSLMKVAVKVSWLSALRGGAYRQGRGALRDLATDAYCPWGVLCDLYDRSVWAVDGTFMGEQAFPPNAVLDWAGFTEKLDDLGRYTPQITINGDGRGISWHNDDGGRTFAELADAIEQQV